MDDPEILCEQVTDASRFAERVVIGSAELWLGDCRAVLPQLAADSVEMLWTDPPYGHSNADGDFLSARAEIMRDGRATVSAPIANDDADSMREVVDAMLKQAARVLRSESCCCCCCCCGGGGPRPTFAWLAERMDREGLSFFHSVIWDKLNPGVGWRYRRQHEMVMVAHRAAGKLAWSGEVDALPNIYAEMKPRGNDHPNLKPLGLISRFIRAHTSAGETVLDPFMGSGTTGVAAVQLGRKFIGIELDPKHFATACRRIEQAQHQLFMPAAGQTQHGLFQEENA